MAYALPELPYALDALAPHISKQTLEFHYGKHHKGYVDKLNAAVAGTDQEKLSLEELILKSDGGVFNNAAQVWNHTFYWNGMKPNGGGEPTGAAASAINESFGSFGEFKEEFNKSASTLFGSGWTWLVKGTGGKLEIRNGANAANPLTDDLKPVLTCDVWEHAYYLDYQNARPKYLESWWKLVNWSFVEQNLS